jgi:predicted dehydrogenase
MNLSHLLEMADRRSGDYYSDVLSLDLSGMHVVVVGYGSIGKRIANQLETCGVRVTIVSRHIGSEATFSNRIDRSHMNADMVVVATETTDHVKQLNMLYELDYRGPIYVEKPLVSSSKEIDTLCTAYSKEFTDKIFCGYNFRYHLLTEIVCGFISKSAPDRFFVRYIYNENVKTWNNSIPWHASYATSPEGGGAILTLSHAIDQLRFMVAESISFEPIMKMPNILNTASNEGVVARINAVAKLRSIDGLLEIGYHSYPGVHSISINTAHASVEADFKSEELRIGDPENRVVSTKKFEGLRDLSIRKSLTTLLLTKQHSCNFMESASTISICEHLLS